MATYASSAGTGAQERRLALGSISRGPHGVAMAQRDVPNSLRDESGGGLHRRFRGDTCPEEISQYRG